MTTASRLYERVPLRDGFPSFSKQEIDRRHAVLRGILERENVDCAIVYGAGRFHPDLLYLSNWPGGTEGYVLLPLAGEPVLLVQLYNHVPMAERLSLIPDTRWGGPDAITTVAAHLTAQGLQRGRVGLIGGLPFSAYERLKAALPDAELVDLSRPYRERRLIRSEEELQFFRAGSAVTDRAMEALETQLRPGLREYELAAIVEGAFLEEGGYTGIHFMASTPMKEPTTFVPHQYQSDRVIQYGDAVITEITGSFWGYGGQIHRTFCLGDPTSEWVRLHEVAVATYEAVEGVLKDGATVEQVMDAAEVVHRAGYTIFDDLLHGAGLSPPVLRTWSTQHTAPSRTFGVADRHPGFIFRENMVVTIQPQPTTLDRRMGLQFGETVRITRDGVERLNHYPRKLVVLS